MAEFPAIDQEILGADADRRVVRVLREVNGAIRDLHEAQSINASRAVLSPRIEPPVFAPQPSSVVVRTESGSNTLRNVFTVGAAVVLGSLLFGSCQEEYEKRNPNQTIHDQIQSAIDRACAVVEGNMGVQCPEGALSSVSEGSPTSLPVTDTTLLNNGSKYVVTPDVTPAPRAVTCYPITPVPGTANTRDICLDTLVQSEFTNTDGTTQPTIQIGVYGRISEPQVTSDGFTYFERSSQLPVTEWFTSEPGLCQSVADSLQIVQSNNDGSKTVIAETNSSASALRVGSLFDSVLGSPLQVVCDFVNATPDQNSGA